MGGNNEGGVDYFDDVEGTDNRFIRGNSNKLSAVNAVGEFENL